MTASSANAFSQKLGPDFVPIGGVGYSMMHVTLYIAALGYVSMFVT